MRQIIFTFSFIYLLSISYSFSNAVDDILNVGSEKYFSGDIQLNSGAYIVKMRSVNDATEEDNGHVKKNQDNKYKMIVQNLDGDNNKKIIIISRNKILKGKEVGSGWIFFGEMNHAGTLNLIPLILENGIIKKANEGYNPHSQAALITPADHDFDNKNRYSHYIRGVNGGLSGMFGDVRKDFYSFKKIEFKSILEHTKFEAKSVKDSYVYFENDILWVKGQADTSTQYQVIELNSSVGGITALTLARYNSRLLSYNNSAQTKKLGLILKYGEKQKNEIFLIASPIGVAGKYFFEIFKPVSNKTNWGERFLRFIMD